MAVGGGGQRAGEMEAICNSVNIKTFSFKNLGKFLNIIQIRGHSPHTSFLLPILNAS